jgi:amidase
LSGSHPQNIKAYTARINAVSHLNSIIEFNPLASTHALAADAERRIALLNNQVLPPLHGIPILIKDNIATSPDLGNTTAGSFALYGSITRADSTLVRKLLETGAIILGKTNMDEFAKARDKDAWGWR